MIRNDLVLIMLMLQSGMVPITVNTQETNASMFYIQMALKRKFKVVVGLRWLSFSSPLLLLQ